MKISEIKIPDYMCQPNEKKYNATLRYYKENRTLDKPIIVDEMGILRDGYVRYLVLKDLGYAGDIEKVKVDAKFAYCVHDGNPKEYVWRVRAALAKDLKPGDKLFVPCKKKYAVVTVVRVSDEQPQTNWPIRAAKRKWL